MLNAQPKLIVDFFTKFEAQLVRLKGYKTLANLSMRFDSVICYLIFCIFDSMYDFRFWYLIKSNQHSTTC